jgi:DNA-binding transcriptional ArsR family regulator
MTESRRPGLQFIHRALADPVRLRVIESLWKTSPQSARELAEWAGVQPDRLYYHLAQLEKAGLIEIAEYRPLPGGKVERMYRPTTIEPPAEAATPLEVAQFLNTILEATQVDIAAASLAKERGERREISLSRTTLHVSEDVLVTLREQIQALVRTAHENPSDDGVWTRVVVTFVDLEDRDRQTSAIHPAESQQ